MFMGPGLAHLGAAVGRKWLRARARLRRGFSIGIAGRLATSFAAVAVLAIAANVMIEREIAVVRTTRLDRGQYSPVPDTHAPAIALSPATAPPSAVTRETVHSELPTADIDSFQAALEHYQRAIETRVSMDTSSAEDGRRAAQRDLELAAKALGKDQARGRAVQTALTSYERAGVDFVDSADQRRSVLQLYQDRLDTMDKRITASMNRALKLFGRVFARQSLLRLHASVDELQRHFSAAASVVDPQALDALAESENALQSAFQADTASFSRSEGEDWVREMHRDLAQLATLRTAGIETGNTLREQTARFAAGRDGLLASVPEIVSDSLTAPERRAAAAPAQSVPALPPAIASPIVDAVTTTTTTTTTVPDRHRRLMVAWITAAVLLVWLIIAVWTMRSILIPVGRLIEATRKLARGEDVRAPRGGLKELNALSVAFNRMAFQLRAAREITQDYRRTLETQVEQRTRLLQHLAEHDPLTLLANRRQFFILLNGSLERARQRGVGVAVFFIDLDNFKNLNDSMGHAFGDRVLISVAQRLEETAQSLGFAARLGGDEFTIVHEQADSPQSALLAGHRIVSAFERPLSVDGRAITVTVSIGTSFYPDHEQTAEDLLGAADAALFRAKALGRNQAALFTRELLEAATRKFVTEQGIRRALEHQEFELLFQPEVRLDSLRVGLVEALVRWRTPDGRLAAPGEFLAVTEESGLILELGDWVLRRAIETAANWRRTCWPEVKVAINVSPRQLASTSFVDRVQRLMQEFELPARCIELELTESVLQTGAATIESLRLLRSLDIAIALDDFGTGYSSFASLEQLPLSRIKLDRALIAGIDTNPRSAAIAMALILLCEDLGIEVTAEGVERNTQFSCLAANPTLYVQGFLISPPVSEAEVPLAISTMPQTMQDLLLSIPGTARRSDAVRRVGAFRDLTRGAVKR
jgi:diguanylate cyclase (GGDEF)-like protein